MSSSDGADQVWGLISTLVAGPAVWGAVGYGADQLAGTPFLTPVGVVVGFITSFYIVYVKATRADAATQTAARTSPQAAHTSATTGPQTAPLSRSELPPGESARPDPGDLR